MTNLEWRNPIIRSLTRESIAPQPAKLRKSRIRVGRWFPGQVVIVVATTHTASSSRVRIVDHLGCTRRLGSASKRRTGQPSARLLVPSYTFRKHIALRLVEHDRLCRRGTLQGKRQHLSSQYTNISRTIVTSFSRTTTVNGHKRISLHPIQPDILSSTWRTMGSMDWLLHLEDREA